MNVHRIELACDTTEADEFAAWLNDHGHDAHVGNTTGSRVDGRSCAYDDEARAALNALWDQYCAAAA